MKIKEIFTSVQGEGFYIGEISVFVRLSGCDLDCDWCDTKYAQEGGEEWDIEELCYEIVEECHDHKTDVVVITGGEPFVQKEELMELIEVFPNRIKIAIETHGGIKIPRELFDNDSLFLSMSPKLSNANTDYDEKTFDDNVLTMNKKNFWNCQLKFVIDEPKEDILEVEKLLRSTMSPQFSSLTFQPKAEPDDSLEDLIEKQKELTDYILNHNKFLKYDVRVLPQLHTLMYGQERGR